MNKPNHIAASERIRLRPTTPDDIDYVLGAEADPDNAAFITVWSREDHLATISDADSAHWIIEDITGETKLGFVILFALTSPHQSIELKRITITDKGRGFGREALRLVKRVVFENHAAHRLWLDVMTDNPRAHGLYLSEGFVEEGTLRDCLFIGDRRISLVVLSVLRHEYEKSSR